MRQTKLDFDKFRGTNLPRLAVVAILLTGWFPVSSMAQQKGQRTFSSAQDATNALVAAVQSNDEKAILDILGPNGKQIVSSGDDTEDADDRANFVRRYQEMHRLVKEPDGNITLYIGAENWPTPIPLVNRRSSWYFDTAASEKEILYRRVGENEMSTIVVCQQLAEAEKEYYSAHNNEYAQKIFSDAGQRNGLYWKAKATNPTARSVPSWRQPSPKATPQREMTLPRLPIVAISTTSSRSRVPALQVGPRSYIANGKMTGGFAFVAYPAEYRSSGRDDLHCWLGRSRISQRPR